MGEGEKRPSPDLCNKAAQVGTWPVYYQLLGLPGQFRVQKTPWVQET